MEPSFGVKFVDEAIKRWPIAMPAKPPVFLNVIKFLLERTPRYRFERFMPRVFVFLARCIRSPHAQVAVLALRVWSNAKIAANIMVFAARISPIVADGISRVSTTHWDMAVRRAAAETVVALAARGHSRSREEAGGNGRMEAGEESNGDGEIGMEEAVGSCCRRCRGK